jgi:hypothetical protein
MDAWALAGIALVLMGYAAVSGRLATTPVTQAMVFVAIGLLAGNRALGVVGYSLIGLALGTLVPSTFLAELFPTRLRYSGLSLTFGWGARSSAARPQRWRPSWSGAPATPSHPPGTPPC